MSLKYRIVKMTLLLLAFSQQRMRKVQSSTTMKMERVRKIVFAGCNFMLDMLMFALFVAFIITMSLIVNKLGI